jgi:O-acetylserine/cysteine efflux transporter
MPLRYILMALSVPLIWGMGFFYSKAALANLSPILLMAFSFLVTALVLVWFVKPPIGIMWRLCLIAFISAAVQYSLTFTGLQGLDASTAILVVQLEVPFIVILGTLFLGEQANWRKWTGIFIAFAGVVMIAGEPRLEGSYLPMAMMVGGALTWAIGQVMVRDLGEVGGFTMIAWVAMFATPQLFVFSLIFEDNHLQQIADADWVVWGAVIYMGLIMTALGYSTWYHLLGKFPVAVVAPYLLLLPVFSIAASVFFLGERLSSYAIFGALIVIAGLTFIVVDRWPWQIRVRSS